eukprot:672530-Pelagomonas_calceolata.AAC.5
MAICRHTFCASSPLSTIKCKSWVDARKEDAKDYVSSGGSYLGLCAGAYYACSRVEFELHEMPEAKSLGRLLCRRLAVRKQRTGMPVKSLSAKSLRAALFPFCCPTLLKSQCLYCYNIAFVQAAAISVPPLLQPCVYLGCCHSGDPHNSNPGAHTVATLLPKLLPSWCSYCSHPNSHIVATLLPKPLPSWCLTLLLPWCQHSCNPETYPAVLVPHIIAILVLACK